MKWKHIPLLLLALLITGACVASPFIVSELQNWNILQSAMADSAVAIGKSLDIESRSLTHGEKMRLFIDFGTTDSSVTCTRQSNNYSTRLTEDTIKEAALNELIELLASMHMDIGFPIKEPDAFFSVIQCSPTTYIDRDDLPRHAIFWLVEMASENHHLYLVLDDETHKIYSVEVGRAYNTASYSSVETDGEYEPLSSKELVSYITGFGEYLDLSGIDGEQIAALSETYDGGSFYYTYQDANGNALPIHFGFYDQSFTIEMVSSRVAGAFSQ